MKKTKPKSQLMGQFKYLSQCLTSNTAVVKKSKDERYEGLHECFKNVRNCNVHGKLSYALY